MIEATSLTSLLPRMIAHPEALDAFGELDWWFEEFTQETPKLYCRTFRSIEKAVSTHPIF